jgi:hypothetical protein
MVRKLFLESITDVSMKLFVKFLDVLPQGLNVGLEIRGLVGSDPEGAQVRVAFKIRIFKR